MRWRIPFLTAAAAFLVLVGGSSPGLADPFMKKAPEQPTLAEENRPSPAGGVGRALMKLQRELNREIGRRMRAIRDGESSAALLAGITVAFLYGVFHALGPGHGKFVVVSYFLSREARLWRGLLMGLQIALTHVISAIVLLWLADLSLKHVVGGSATEMREARLVSYGATAALGVFMLVRAIKRSIRRPSPEPHQEGKEAHGHGRKQQGLVSFSLGLVPCTGALLIMLFALANNMVFAGSIMVAAIAAGMAVTMSVLGILGILARRVVLSGLGSGAGKHARLAAALECAGALVILIISSLLFIGAL
jgi:nickel/cobalt exporter